MLEIEYFSSLYAQFRLLIVACKTSCGHGLRKRFIFQTLKGKNDYVVILFK